MSKADVVGGVHLAAATKKPRERKSRPKRDMHVREESEEVELYAGRWCGKWFVVCSLTCRRELADGRCLADGSGDDGNQINRVRMTQALSAGIQLVNSGQHEKVGVTAAKWRHVGMRSVFGVVVGVLRTHLSNLVCRQWRRSTWRWHSRRRSRATLGEARRTRCSGT